MCLLIYLIINMIIHISWPMGAYIYIIPSYIPLLLHVYPVSTNFHSYECLQLPITVLFNVNVLQDLVVIVG